jgi:hypothetical protein
MESPPQKSNLNERATQTLRILVDRGEDRSKFFFVRRKPKNKVKREWERPPDKEYVKLLMAEGFITEELVGGKLPDELSADVRELDQHLLPHFWRVDQLARYYQNRYYQYQWAFILAAFLTTALAAINVFLHTQGDRDIGTLSGVLGFLTAIVSGVAATVSFLDANQTPQKRWYKARAQAEGLRSLYFLFLARQRPFDSESARDRVHRMRQKVIDVLRSEGSNIRVRASVRPSAASQPASSKPAAPPAKEPDPPKQADSSE